MIQLFTPSSDGRSVQVQQSVLSSDRASAQGVICPGSSLYLPKPYPVLSLTPPERARAQVVIYHGPKRTADPAALAGADVVLTTYSVLENEFRRFMQPGKVPCGYCGKKFEPARLKVHLRCARPPRPGSTRRQPRAGRSSSVRGGRTACSLRWAAACRLPRRLKPLFRSAGARLPAASAGAAACRRASPRLWL